MLQATGSGPKGNDVPPESSMASLFKVGTALRGQLSTYSIVKELHRAADEGAVFLAT
jgi:hypothetical protein